MNIIKASGFRTRHTSGIFLPVPRALLWRDERVEYKTRKGNTPRRLVSVIESCRPQVRGIQYQKARSSTP